MSYRPDPGGVFDSDTHRRVCSHVPDPGTDPMDLNTLGIRISPDKHSGLKHVDELAAVLKDLEGDGLVKENKGGWVTTNKGMEALAAPAPEPDPNAEVRPALLGGIEVNLNG